MTHNKQSGQTSNTYATLTACNFYAQNRSQGSNQTYISITCARVANICYNKMTVHHMQCHTYKRYLTKLTTKSNLPGMGRGKFRKSGNSYAFGFW